MLKKNKESEFIEKLEGNDQLRYILYKIRLELRIWGFSILFMVSFLIFIILGIMEVYTQDMYWIIPFALSFLLLIVIGMCIIQDVRKRNYGKEYFEKRIKK